MVNAGVCLRPDETLSNILAMKLAYPGKVALCCKFRPRDDLFSGVLNSAKKKRYLICYKRDHTNRVILKQTDDSPNGKRVLLILIGKKKIESHYFL